MRFCTDMLEWAVLAVLITVLAVKIIAPLGNDVNRQFRRIAATLEIATKGIR